MKPLIAMICLLALSVGNAETTITYQGQLQDAGGPFTGSPGMGFRLFDSLTDGSQIGDTAFFTAVSVDDGLFQVELDFGTGSFDGGARWLEIEVAGDILQPRQKITGSPWSLQALSVAAGSVGSDQIAPGAVGSNQIASGAVGSDELQSDSVSIGSRTGLEGGGEISLGGSATISIADGGVGSAQIAPGAVTSSTIATGAVGAAQANDTQIQLRISGTCDPGTTLTGIGKAGHIWTPPVCQLDEGYGSRTYIRRLCGASFEPRAMMRSVPRRLDSHSV